MIEKTVEIRGHRYTIWAPDEETVQMRIRLLEEMPEEEPVEEEVVE
jgi:hypothetical protein